MLKQVITLVAAGAIFTGIGLWAGLAVGGKAAGPAPADTHDEAAAATALAPETLRNMGVEVAPAKLSTFHRYVPITAEVAVTPRTRQAVYAPGAGRVEQISARFGAMVAAGEKLVVLVRDPLPRVELRLTRHFLEPSSETLHETMTTYRRAVVGLEVLKTERERIAGFGGGDQPVIPKSRLVQLGYDILKAERELASVRHELVRHGLNTEQIDELQHGCFPKISVAIWRAALEHNGFWTPQAAALFEPVPAELKQLPWTAATIGEIVAGGYEAGALAAWFKREPAAARHILEIGGLLQRGHSLTDIRDRYALGAFDARVVIRAPAASPDWDVDAILVKPGEHVEAGHVLLTLKDPRHLWLRARPAGSEVASVLHALEAKASMRAEPLVKGAAPPIDGVTFTQVRYEVTDRAVAYAVIENAPLRTASAEGAPRFRTWRHGEGQRYVLRAPTETLNNVYVFPAGAVTDRGPDKVVFLKSGDSFLAVKVEVLHRDHESVVIAGTANIFPGNPVVVGGAFPLGLALEAGQSGGGDGGHGHAH